MPTFSKRLLKIRRLDFLPYPVREAELGRRVRSFGWCGNLFSVMPQKVEGGSGENGDEVCRVGCAVAQCRGEAFDEDRRDAAAEGGPDQGRVGMEQGLCGLKTGEESQGKKQTGKAVPEQAGWNESAVEFENNVQSHHGADLPDWAQERYFHRANRMTMPEPVRVSARSMRI